MFQVPDPYTAFNNYQILRMCKAVYDYKKDLMQHLDGIHIEGDYFYDAFWICISCTIKKVRQYYSENWEGEIMFIRDPWIDEYLHFAYEFGRLSGTPEDQNTYIKDALSTIDNALCYQDSRYDCDFRYNKKTGKGCRIILAPFADFSNYYEIVEGMIGMVDFFEQRIEKLRKEIESLKRLEAAA